MLYWLSLVYGRPKMGLKMYCTACSKPLTSEMPSHMGALDGAAYCWACVRLRQEELDRLKRLNETLERDLGEALRRCEELETQVGGLMNVAAAE